MAEYTIWCVVPAAGSGSRFGGSTPKQYLSLGERMVIDATLATLLSTALFETIVVVLDESDANWALSEFSEDTRVVTVPGGRERSDSVIAGLDMLRDRAAEDDWVMVHDAARPCVSKEDVCELAAVVTNSGRGGLIAAPVADTLKRVDEHGEVLATVERASLWRALTPQCFRYGELYRALIAARDIEMSVTDEAAAMEAAGHPIQVVAGDAENIKITTASDLELAGHILACGRE